MKAWNVTELEIEYARPLVLDSEDEGRLIALRLPAGERLGEHQVHERAWLMVVSGAVEIIDSDGEVVGGGAGLIAEFRPNERRQVRATEDAIVVLLLSPWPGDGHPRTRGQEEPAGA